MQIAAEKMFAIIFMISRINRHPPKIMDVISNSHPPKTIEQQCMTSGFQTVLKYNQNILETTKLF
jgi:hypothetical protein